MALTAKRKEEVAELLRNAASWVDGDRSVALLALSKEIGEGVEQEKSEKAAIDELAKTYDAPELESYVAEYGQLPPHQSTPEVAEQFENLETSSKK